MAEQIRVGEQAIVPGDDDGRSTEIAADLAYKRLAIVNVGFYGARGAREWVLIDAGVAGTAGLIKAAAEERYGATRPAAIVLTHGHFDHIGALEELLKQWDEVPVYAHPLEHPYLDGSSSYPPPDPTVGGGLMALMSPLYPRGPIDVSRRLRALTDAGVPGMAGWKALHTPGHTPGHVSLWSPATRTLIAGDAFITTAQESAYAVAVQKPELHGPPMYYTPDWASARASVEKLAALQPRLVLTGHGQPMQGDEMLSALEQLARNFDEVAVPKQGRYVEHPRS